ncbi:hypothetical protein DFH11DRAFT_893798 [Phellopilus nigrolimitatus]|nr:hypothetical protein DFH11DRAFT_893798 [Phellopilus nigrolimitatus]
MPSSQLLGKSDVPLVPVAPPDYSFGSVLRTITETITGTAVDQNDDLPYENNIWVDAPFHRTEENTVINCIDPALLTLNPATTASIGNYEVAEAGGDSEPGFNQRVYPSPPSESPSTGYTTTSHSPRHIPVLSIQDYHYDQHEDNQASVSANPCTALQPTPPYSPRTGHPQALLGGSIADGRPPAASTSVNTATAVEFPGLPSYDAPPAIEIFSRFPWGDGDRSQLEHGNGMSTADPSYTLSLAPTALAFPASGYNVPEFVQGSSSGAPAANVSRSSEAGPSRTDKKTKAARASKAAKSSKDKKTAKAARQTAASPDGGPEAAFKMTEPSAPNPSRREYGLITFALPVSPTSTAPRNDAQVINIPDFIEGSSGGALATARASQAGPSRTEKTTKTTRANKAKSSKAKNTAKATRQTAASPDEDAFRMTEPRAPNSPRQDHRLNPFALPAVPGFPTSWSDAQAYAIPDFIEGSSGGAPVNAPASETELSRTNEGTGIARQAAASPSDEPEAPRLYCDYPGCSSSCKNINELRRHRAGCPFGPDGGASARANCPYCPKTYSRFDAMRRHCADKHPDKKLPSNT